MSAVADGLAAFAAAMVELPLRLARIEAQQRQILERFDALAESAGPALVDVAEAARRLGRSPASVRRACAAGELPAVRLGRAWRVDLAQIGRRARPEEISELAAEARSR